MTSNVNTQILAMVAPVLDAAWRSGLQPPPGHRFHFDIKHQTTWNAGMAGNSLSAFIQRCSQNDDDPLQVHIEMRVFADEPRAMVWAQLGARWTGQNQSLIDGGSTHVHASSYQDLAKAIVAVVNDAIRTRAAAAQRRP